MSETKKTRIKPLNDLVLLERKASSNKTEGGLYKPERRDREHGEVIECRVLAVGPGTADHNMRIALASSEGLSDGDFDMARDAKMPGVLEAD